MPPKKYNGFMTFVHEWRNKNEARRRMSTDEAVRNCGEIWKNMDAQQRGPYYSGADILRGRMSSMRQLNSNVKQMERSLVDEEMDMKRSIERIVAHRQPNQDLANYKFTFCSFNYFTKEWTGEIYLPAEFAACQFTLKSGQMSIYSSYINPGQLFRGQRSFAQHHSSNTHQLPLPPDSLGESDMGKLFASIVQYLRTCQDNGSDNGREPLVVFTKTNLIPAVKSCFNYLSKDCDYEKDLIVVYDIQYLFFVLKKEIMNIAGLPHDHIVKYVTDTLFLNDFFEHNAGISCQFHEEKDRGKYCAQSQVTRWCYMFSDYMCGDLDIKLLPGRHMPPKQEVNFRVTIPNSGNTSPSSYQSEHSDVKQEYVPRDHTASSTTNVTIDSSRFGRRNTNPRNIWDIPALNLSAVNLEDEFSMSPGNK